MNSILYAAPENCLDILRGAVTMTQVKTIGAGGMRCEMASTSRRASRAKCQLWLRVFEERWPLRYDFEAHGMSGTFSPSVEDRLALVIEFAMISNTRILDPLVAEAVDQVVEAWREDRPNVPEAMAAIRLLGDYALQVDPWILALRWRLIAALATQEEQELSPSDLARLLGVIADATMGDEIRRAFVQTARGWSRSMGDRLRDCRSDFELEMLGRDLRAVSDALGIDLRGPIQAVDVELRMYVDPDEPEPEHDAARERQVRRQMVDRVATRQLFDTLRRGEDD